MDPTAGLPTVEQSSDESPEPGDLFAPYQPYSLDWLNRLRMGEVDFTRPARLSA